MIGHTMEIAEVLSDPLAQARSAGRAIGYVGTAIAEDVLAAPPLFAAHLPWRNGRETPAADCWLEASFPGWARSILDDWLAGDFDFFESVVFTRGDDTSQRLYYYVCELQRRGVAGGPRPLIFDVATIPRTSSRQWTANAVHRLAVELGLDDVALEQGIRTANRRRQLMADADRRRGHPSHLYEQLARASLFVPIERLETGVAATGPGGRGRVLLAGSSPPDDSLHRAVDASGWNVVGELYDRSLARLGPPVAEQGGSPADRIGAGVLANQAGPRYFADGETRVLTEVDRRAVDAVIYWLHEEDEAIAWDVVRSGRALRERDVPTLILARRNWDLSDSPGAEVTEFLGGLAR